MQHIPILVLAKPERNVEADVRIHTTRLWEWCTRIKSFVGLDEIAPLRIAKIKNWRVDDLVLGGGGAIKWLYVLCRLSGVCSLRQGAVGRSRSVRSRLHSVGPCVSLR